MRIILILSTFLLIFQTSSANNMIRIIASDFPPYTIEKGEEIEEEIFQTCSFDHHIGYGIDVDILVRALDISGFDHSIRFVPFARLKKN